MTALVHAAPWVLLSATAYAASFHAGCALFAWVALVPLLVMVTRLTPGVAAGAGLSYGIIAAYGVGWWFPGMLAEFFGTSLLVGALGFVLVASISGGLHYAAFAAWVSWLARRRRSTWIALTAGWVTCEFARGRLAGMNPWALSAYSQANALPLIQIADLAGPYGIGLLIGGVNVALAGLRVPRLVGGRPLRALVAATVTVLASLAYGTWRLQAPAPPRPSVRVAVIQGGIARTGDRSDAAREEKTRRYLDLTDRIVSADTSLIVWPEYALESYIQEPTRDRAAVLALSRRLHADLVLGGPRYDVIGRAVRYYNAAFLVRDGRVVAHEDKVQLLPLAELGVLGLGAGRAKYAPGNRHDVLPVRGSRLGTFLCWESMHPHLVRDVAVDADILANLSNDDWFGHPFPARHQLDIARFRAIENRRVLVRATATGFSAVVDPQGRIVAISGFGGSPEALQALVQPSRESTPYQHVGDALCWLALVVVIGTSGYAARRPRPIV